MHRNANSSSGMAELILENTHPLQQLTDLLRVLSCGQYSAGCNARGQHTIGKHVRHVVDHYSVFLSGVERIGSAIDYEQRSREALLEQEPQATADRLSKLCQRLERLGNSGEDHPLQLDYATHETTVATSSSLGRELAFLASHTIHHMAIIAMLAEQVGIATSEDFGVHPSTLRYRQKQEMLQTLGAEQMLQTSLEAQSHPARST